MYSLFYKKETKMLFEKKNCPECGSRYDVVEPTCPTCGKRDENFEQHKIPSNLLWLPIYKQILLFVIGLVGLNVVGFIVEIFAILMPKGTFSEAGYTTLVNTVRYVVTFIGMLALIWKDFPKFRRFFNRAKPYLLGLAGGAAILAANITLNLITQAIYPTPENTNQQTVNSVITAFPVISIFVIGLIGPAVEELTYRLGLYTFLRRINKPVAYIITSLIFGLIHFDFFAGTATGYIIELVNLPTYIVVGFLFCLWYEKFGLASSIVAHQFNNLFSILMTVISNLIK